MTLQQPAAATLARRNTTPRKKGMEDLRKKSQDLPRPLFIMAQTRGHIDKMFKDLIRDHSNDFPRSSPRQPSEVTHQERFLVKKEALVRSMKFVLLMLV